MNLLQALMADRVPVELPAAYEAAARAKLKRDRASYEAFRAVDQAEFDRAHERRVAASVAAAEGEVRTFSLDAEMLESEAVTAREASRAADDRARDAQEYARTQEAAAARAREDGSAAEATDAQVRADTADGVAAEREADAAAAREELADLEQDLGEARESLEEAERGLRAARKAAEVPSGAGWGAVVKSAGPVTGFEPYFDSSDPQVREWARAAAHRAMVTKGLVPWAEPPRRQEGTVRAMVRVPGPGGVLGWQPVQAAPAAGPPIVPPGTAGR